MLGSAMPTGCQNVVSGSTAFAHFHLQPSMPQKMSLHSRTTRSSAPNSLCGLTMLQHKPRAPQFGLVHIPRRTTPLVPKCAASSAWAMATIPAGSMFIGGVLPMLLSRAVPKRLVHAMQHFSAGMLLAAIAQEMVPPLAAAEKVREIISIVIGFSLGVACMIGLAAVTSSDGEESESKGNQLKPAAEGPTEGAAVAATAAAEGDKKLEPPAWRNPRRKPGPLQSTAASLRSFIMRIVGGDASKWWSLDRLKAVNATSLPLTLALAVYIDAAVDGLLIGLALASQTGPGLFLAMALAVEMFFLGMTFSTSCQYLRRKVQVLAISLGPMILVTGSYLGGRLAAALAANNAALVGGIAFAAASLLYMVCEELLLDAHEDGQEHVWWIDLQVYLGFMLSLVLEKIV